MIAILPEFHQNFTFLGWTNTVVFPATENARHDIARPDNAAPYRKGGHRETCFSVRVDAHYKFMLDSGSII